MKTKAKKIKNEQKGTNATENKKGKPGWKLPEIGQ